MKRFILSLALASSLVLTVALTAAGAGGGFNQYGYNYTARIFNGTGSSWCLANGHSADCRGVSDYTGLSYANDKLVMKWNAAWDACNALNTPEACAGAWRDNEWNGNVAGGSGESSHYKIVWIGGYCGADYTPLADGGFCLWGSYELLMYQGIYVYGHYLVKAVPNGYGVIRG